MSIPPADIRPAPSLVAGASPSPDVGPASAADAVPCPSADAGPGTVSRIEDVPDTYGRLLTRYTELLESLDVNPYMPFDKLLRLTFSSRGQWRFWTSRSVLDFLKVPDAVRQELPFAADILKPLHDLDDEQLRALVRCSMINVRKLTERSFLSIWNKLFVALVALLTAVKGIQEVFGFSLGVLLKPLGLLAVPVLVGLLIGGVINLSLWYQRMRLVRAFDDIISIAVAARHLRP